MENRNEKIKLIRELLQSDPEALKKLNGPTVSASGVLFEFDDEPGVYYDMTLKNKFRKEDASDREYVGKIKVYRNVDPIKV